VYAITYQALGKRGKALKIFRDNLHVSFDNNRQPATVGIVRRLTAFENRWLPIRYRWVYVVVALSLHLAPSHGRCEERPSGPFEGKAFDVDYVLRRAANSRMLESSGHCIVSDGGWQISDTSYLPEIRFSKDTASKGSPFDSQIIATNEVVHIVASQADELRSYRNVVKSDDSAQSTTNHNFYSSVAVYSSNAIPEMGAISLIWIAYSSWREIPHDADVASGSLSIMGEIVSGYFSGPKRGPKEVFPSVLMYTITNVSQNRFPPHTEIFRRTGVTNINGIILPTGLALYRKSHGTNDEAKEELLGEFEVRNIGEIPVPNTFFPSLPRQRTKVEDYRFPETHGRPVEYEINDGSDIPPTGDPWLSRMAAEVAARGGILPIRESYLHWWVKAVFWTALILALWLTIHSRFVAGKKSKLLKPVS
jgi:hypothetical protein